MKWMKRQLAKPQTYIILFIASLLIPFIINQLYKYGQNCGHSYITMWDADDVLSFYGSYLSFFGSAVLGTVAVFQTVKANKQSDTANSISNDALEQAKQSNRIAQEALVQTQRANDLAAQMQKLEQAKFVSLVSMERLITTKQSFEFDNYHNSEMPNIEIMNMVSPRYRASIKHYHVDVRFKNDSDFPILHISANAGDRNNNKALDYGIKADDKDIYIPPRKTICIRFLLPTRAFEDYKIRGVAMQFSFTNVYDYSTFAFLAIEDLTVNGANNGYTYQLAKFTDINHVFLADSNKLIEVD